MPAHISESTFIIACNSRKKGLLEGVTFIYKGTELLYVLHVQEPIQAFIYGPYGFGEQGFIFNTTGMNMACFSVLHLEIVLFFNEASF